MKQFHTFFTAKAATGIGEPCNCIDWERFSISLDSTESSSWTVKFQISSQESKPDFSAAASHTNKWSYVDTIDVVDGSSVDGSAGIAAAAGVVHKILQPNAEGFVWLNAIVTAHTGGAVTCEVVKSNNNR